MKINGISLSNNIHIASQNFLKTRKPNSLELKNDVFVRTNPLNFKGITQNNIYNDFKNELVTYVYNTDEVDLKDVEIMFKKYSPTVSVDDFKNLPRKNLTAGTCSYISQQMYLIANGDKLEVQQAPQTVYLIKPKKGSETEKAIFLDRALHEFTHALQETKSNDTLENRTNKHLKNISNVNLAQNSLMFSQKAFVNLESSMIYALASLFPSMKSIPQEINRHVDIDRAFEKKYKMNAGTYIRYVLDKTLTPYKNSVDMNFVKDIMKYKAESEKEAYEHSLDFHKEALGLQNKKTDFDIRIEMYDKIISVLESSKF